MGHEARGKGKSCGRMGEQKNKTNNFVANEKKTKIEKEKKTQTEEKFIFQIPITVIKSLLYGYGYCCDLILWL